jgi:hypothetical protein
MPYGSIRADSWFEWNKCDVKWPYMLYNRPQAILMEKHTQPDNPTHSPPEIPAHPEPRPEIQPSQQPEPEIPQLPPDTGSPGGPEGPEIIPDPSPPEVGPIEGIQA